MSSFAAALLRAGWLPDRSAFFAHQNILVFYLLAVGLTSFLFYLIPPGYYDRNANLAATVFILGQLPLAWHRRWHAAVVHACTLATLVLITYIASQSGGVNSSAMVWLNVAALPVLLLLGPRATLAWIGMVLATILGLFLAMHAGVVDSHAQSSAQAVPWTWMNHAMAMCNLMLGIRLYDHLHDQQLQQLRQRNDDIKATHQALLKAQAHKDNFVAAVGHELRTPMNAILGFNGVLRHELADQPEQVAVVDHIRQSTGHLLQVVNDILDFSQLQAGKMRLYPVDFDLAVLIDEALHGLRAKALDKGLALTAHIDPDLPAHLHADRQRLLQILRNLLANAVKFTDHGVVTLRATRQADVLRFEVTDTGRGIALARQAHIFSRFEHADVQTTRAYGGTGLGLSICEKLVHLQGGQIGVVSEEGHGARFWFEVPLQAAQTPVDAFTSTVPGLDDQPLRILVVDDNAMNLMVARLQLQKCWPHAEVVTADSAAAALSLLDASVFDVALVDMVMPDMDGMQLTQQIRLRFPAITASMPILALTANTNPVDRQRCLNAGMCDVLAKPMDPQTLVRSISEQVQRARRVAA